jgi:hypothetical protein
VSSTHLIAAGSLVAALAAAAAWYAISPSNTAKPDSASQPAKPQRPLRSRTPSSRPITAPPLADASTTNTASAPNRSAASTLLPNPTGNPANPSPTDAPALSHDDLVARAARIEQETNHDLRRLVSLLNLSDAQQDQVFNALASRSPHWVPGMATAGTVSSPTTGSSPSSSDPTTSTAPPAPTRSPSASTTDSPVTDSATSPAPAESDALSSILPFLTPEQQEALLADEMDKSAWWEEIIPQLLPDESLPAINGDTPTTPDSPETKEFSGPDTLE